VRPENFSFLAGNYGRELIEIADEDHLHAAKRLFLLRAVEPQKFIHAIQQISPHHRNFVDNNCCEFFIKRGLFFCRALFLFDRCQCNIGLEVKERMNCLAGNIDCRDARRRQHDYFFLRMIAKIIEQRGFACARAAGNQQALGRIFHQRKSPLEFGIEVNFDLFECFSHYESPFSRPLQKS